MAEFKFRGKSADEVQKMNLEEYSMLLTSRMRRALRRGLTPAQEKLIQNIRKSPKKFHKVHCRGMVILPEMVGVKIGVFSGKDFIAIEIKDYMIGHRLGEFVLTRKQVRHSAPGFGATKSSKFVPLK